MLCYVCRVCAEVVGKKTPPLLIIATRRKDSSTSELHDTAAIATIITINDIMLLPCAVNNNRVDGIYCRSDSNTTDVHGWMNEYHLEYLKQ